MAADILVTDPALLSVLQSADHARQKSLAILDLLDSNHASETSADERLLREQKTLNAHLAILRGMNRKAVLNVRRTKQETAEARQEIDALHLQLQNLYYKQSHLKGEIVSCERYEHKYRNLSMISEEEYLELHPEHAELAEDELTKARIEDEHRARQTLDDEKQALRKRKEALLKVTNDKKEQLARLDSEIEKWVEGESTVRKLFETRAQSATLQT